MKKLLAVIGNPIAHSMSPLIHGRAIDSLGLDFVYVAFAVESAKAAVEAMRTLGIRGYSVTIPHKESILPCLDELDLSAERCRSVNTVVNNGGRLKGYSTDGPGAVGALSAAGIHLPGINVEIIGTGGAARAIAFALKDAGVSSIRFRGEDMPQQRQLEKDLGSVVRNLPGTLLINASPVGMHPNVDAMPIDSLDGFTAVFDIVYNPIRTKLLEHAHQRGLTTVSGVGMFAEQAALQFELFTGHVAPRELMTQTVMEALEKN